MKCHTASLGGIPVSDHPDSLEVEILMKTGGLSTSWVGVGRSPERNSKGKRGGAEPFGGACD